MSTLGENIANLQQCPQVFLLSPSGETEKCDSYLKLSTGTKLLVTMPEANPSQSFHSNLVLHRMNKLAKKLSQYGIETFALLPNDYRDMQNWLKEIEVTQFSMFCDPQNVISNALNITITYEGPSSMKHPKAPERLHILLREGTVVHVKDTDKDWDFRSLLNNVSELFSNTDKQASSV
jgi:hypothetical protein